MCENGLFPVAFVCVREPGSEAMNVVSAMSGFGLARASLAARTRSSRRHV